jgi:hypothetical protein
MVGPWGLEPQTSTVSILRAMQSLVRRREHKLQDGKYLIQF